MELSLYFTLLLLTSGYLTCAADDDGKTRCQGCRDLVEGILKGLDRTKSKNYEGGDVDWEEKKLGKYKKSEVRLIEILESACAKSNHKCLAIQEEFEDDIEDWYKKDQDTKPLQKVLCVDKAKVCCDEDTFGPDCTDCPKGLGEKLCSGRGTCEGSGDREGSGKCVCDDGYSGELCDECAERYYNTFSNDTYTMCSLCHQSCKTCKANKSTDCITCMEGYREEENIDNEEEKKCIDINECVESQNLCPVGTYCANTEGSYTCEACSIACSDCFGPSYKHCYACKPGTIMKFPYMCQDIDECGSGAICLGMYEVCVNTLGHYKCECARYFRRDSVSGQCQPDPAIYSHLRPPSHKPAAPAPDSSSKKEDSGERVETESAVEDSLSEDDIKRLIVAVLICIIGTAAASGNLIWTALFFLSILCAGIWWASDKSEEIAKSFIKRTEL